MDQPKYSTLMAALQTVPDPRHARGRRHRWRVILSLIAAALVSGQRNGRAIGQWVHEHAGELSEALAPQTSRLPSPSTLERAWRAVDIQALEQRVADYIGGLAGEAGQLTLVSGTRLQAQAVDGKEVRGARDGQQTTKLVSLVGHGSGQVLAQRQVQDGQGEQTAVAEVLAERSLAHTLTTLDAGLTTRPLARLIRARHGHYFMVIKANQPETYAALAFLFDPPPQVQWLPQERAAHYRVAVTVHKGHGRLERRQVETSSYLNDYLSWPDVGQVMRRTCRRHNLKTGHVSQAVTYGLTSLPWHEAGPDLLEQLWRGHWTIENRLHYVRDETFGEDRCRTRTGHGCQALAAFRNALLALLRAHGWLNIADALRHYGSSVRKALALIGAVPAEL